MLRWTERAVADLIAIGDYIALDRPGAARAWVERLRRRAQEAEAMPNAARLVPELGRTDVREVFLQSYRIVYRVVADGITILTVFEGHRRLGELDPDTEE
jgi:plasmid stabilization system protein ParE